MRLRHQPIDGTGARVREDIDRLRDEFISTVSHELRTPVATLHGAALTLRFQHLDAQVREQLVDLIELQSGRLCELVEELLLAASLRNRAAREPFEELVDLVELVLEEAGRVTPVAFDVRSRRACVAGARHDLRRVVRALLEYAAARTPEGAELRARVTTSAGRARLEVAGWHALDGDGDGERLFEPFSRSGGADSASPGGLGLSLYVAKELARGLDGLVFAYCDRRRNGRLTLELPLASTSPARE